MDGQRQHSIVEYSSEEELFQVATAFLEDVSNLVEKNESDLFRPFS